MPRQLFLVIAAIFALAMLSSQLVSAALISPDENSAKRYVSEKLINKVKFWEIKNMTVGLFNGSKAQLFDRVCPVNLVWNDSIEACQRPVTNNPPPPPPPVVCDPGYHLENGVCVKDPTPVPTTIPVLNTSKTFRICIVADVDDNSGLTTQMNLAKKYGCQYLVLPGDYAYSGASGAISKIKAVFPSGRTIVAVGNHDSCSNVKSWIGVASCYYEKYASDGKVQFQVIDANSGFDCTGTQFQKVKENLVDSDAWYKVVVVHQPFATVKSDHGPNGKFSCYDAVFQANGVDLVAQGHNHNFQFGDFTNTWYGVFGTGTHDTGSSMYGCDSSSFNSVDMHCKTGTNGITFVDFPIDKQGFEKYYFVNNADKLVTSWGGQ